MKEVKIGSQVWAKKDLRVMRFRNGDLIPVVQDDKEWSKLETAAMCFNPDTGKALYNWYAVNDERGLAPEGWHVPSDEEWTELMDYLGGDASNKIKHRKKWDGSNSSGFSALPGGLRNFSYGYVYNGGVDGYWWSASPNGTSDAWFRSLYSGNGIVFRHYANSRYGFSVRCVKD